jgi:uncharacterized membrane protein YqgA involved in biofilm formation
VIGTIINGAAIVAGGLLGRFVFKSISPANQQALKVLLGVFTVYAGLSTTWGALHGGFFKALKQIAIAIVAMMLGKALGRLLRLQKTLNRAGQFAKERFSKATTDGPANASDGFVTCTLLFCVGPMAILGALQDGLTGNFRTLAIKSVMDGLATMGFVTSFGWSPVFAAIPVVAYQGTITLLAQTAAPWLQNQTTLDSINVVGGLLLFSISLIILQLKKIELADYLPSLAIAPLLTWALR